MCSLCLILLTGIRNCVNLPNYTYSGLSQGLTEIAMDMKIVDYTSQYCILEAYLIGLPFLMSWGELSFAPLVGGVVIGSVASSRLNHQIITQRIVSNTGWYTSEAVYSLDGQYKPGKQAPGLATA